MTFSGYNLPNTMDITKWGDYHFYSENKVIIYIKYSYYKILYIILQFIFIIWILINNLYVILNNKYKFKFNMQNFNGKFIIKNNVYFMQLKYQYIIYINIKIGLSIQSY